ncbi:hypothetical protein [Kitasatospora sp. McL0602]|uniref:hypothetical protein n=1 Tax=Kitasatospora sp. McL0602 TaxID=3439530 RepID=UPI003F8B60F9
MNPFSTTRAKILAAAIAVTVTAGVGTAYAATIGPARAPYAQVAALIGNDTKTFQSKGIKNVTKAGTGVFCLTFTSPLVDPQKIVPQATIVASDGTQWGSEVHVRTEPSSSCGEATDTVTVFTGTVNGGPADLNFYFTIA